jgi:hypothetical protein
VYAGAGRPVHEDEPCLVVEVASANIETTDRREKLAAYKKMSSLRTYLIVARDRPWVERHSRGKDGIWRRADLVDEGSHDPHPLRKTHRHVPVTVQPRGHHRDRRTCKMPGAARVARK